MWRHGLAGAVVVGSFVVLMLASFEANSPILSGWTGGMSRSRLLVAIPARLLGGSTREKAPAAPASPRREPPQSATVRAPSAEPAVHPTPPAPKPAVPPVERVELPLPPPPAPLVKPGVRPRPAPSTAPARVVTPAAPVAPPIAAQAPASVAPPPRPAIPPPQPTVAMQLLGARRQILGGEISAARLALEQAQTRLAFSPGQVDPRVTGQITDTLGALADGDRKAAVRHLDTVLAGR